MDNRWRFLYCVQSELWGRGRTVCPGSEKTGASVGGDEMANPLIKPKA